MDFTEIMNYLEQGFTLEQIKQIQEKNIQNQSAQQNQQNQQNQPAPTAQQNQQNQQNQPAPPAQQNQQNQPEWVTALNDSITKLTHTIQANALSNTSINAPKDIQAQTDDILANILNPTKTGGNT